MFLSQANFDFTNKRVLLRIDCDVDLKDQDGRLIVDEEFRLRSALPTIKFLQGKNVAQIILLGHLGRPEGKTIAVFSLLPIADWFSKNLATCPLINLGDKTREFLVLLENLRFNPGEEENQAAFANQLAEMGDVYVNDAFGVSHRQHASIVGLPKLRQSFLGLRMEEEIKALAEVKKNPRRPLVFVLGGSKSDKPDYLDFLSGWADRVLVGGKLPLLVKSESERIIVAGLTASTKDIDDQSISRFKEAISQAGTLIWAGPMGVYEEKENQKGTLEIAQAIVDSNAFKICGGGDTHRILTWFGFQDKFSFVSVGGGAMLEFLRKDTLPGIAMLENGR